jgi:hypothetical protein
MEFIFGAFYALFCVCCVLIGWAMGRADTTKKEVD